MLENITFDDMEHSQLGQISQGKESTDVAQRTLVRIRH